MRNACLAAVVVGLAARALGQGYVCAEGGGNAGKGAWADEVFGWMVEKGKRGPAVVIGAVPIEKDERIDLFKRLGASDASGLVITQENADSQEVYDAIARAGVVFIRGGAQERYVNWWKGTKTESAIRAVFAKGGVIGGTSAGCAVLGEVTYDSRHGSLHPRDILADARHPDLTLTRDFLGLVPGVLFDTHFTERGRLPRLTVMLATVREETPEKTVVGMGVDPRTAVCVSPDGTAEIKGEGAVTLLQLTPGTRAVLEAGRPPVVTEVRFSQLPAGYVLDLKRMEVLRRPEGVEERRPLTRPAGEFVATRLGAPEVREGAEKPAAPAKPDPLQQDRDPNAPAPEKRPAPPLEMVPREGKWVSEPGLAAAVRVWSGPDIAGSLRSLIVPLAKGDVGAGVLLDETAAVRVSERGLVMVERGTPARSVIVLDAFNASRARAAGVAAVEGVVMHLLAPVWVWEAGDGHVEAAEDTRRRRDGETK